jgi:hypothetical protein
MKRKFKFKVQVLGDASRAFQPRVRGGRIGRVWNTVAVVERMTVAESVRQKLATDGGLARIVAIARNAHVHPLIPVVTAPWQVGGVTTRLRSVGPFPGRGGLTAAV